MYPPNSSYTIGETEKTIDLAAFDSANNVLDCWEYNIFVLGSGVPADDPTAI